MAPVGWKSGAIAGALFAAGSGIGLDNIYVSLGSAAAILGGMLVSAVNLGRKFQKIVDSLDESKSDRVLIHKNLDQSEQRDAEFRSTVELRLLHIEEQLRRLPCGPEPDQCAHNPQRKT